VVGGGEDGGGVEGHCGGGLLVLPVGRSVGGLWLILGDIESADGYDGGFLVYIDIYKNDLSMDHRLLPESR
jgi:hypothetical protein